MEQTFTAEVDLTIHPDSVPVPGYSYSQREASINVQYNVRVDPGKNGLKGISIYGINQTINFNLELENEETGEYQELDFSIKLDMSTDSPKDFDDLSISSLDVEITELSITENKIEALAQGCLIFTNTD